MEEGGIQLAAEQKAALEAQKRAIVNHFNHARERDPDLASLRELPEFLKLFEEGGD